MKSPCRIFEFLLLTVFLVGFVDSFDYKDEVAQGTCTSLISEADHVYAVKRECKTNGITCTTVCSNIGKKCFNALHVYDGIQIGSAVTGKVGLHTYRYNSCTHPNCGPNFCCCSDKDHSLPSVSAYKDQIAQSTCTSILPGNANHIFAIRRECTDAAPHCQTVCSGLGKTCFNSLHVYDGVTLGGSEYGKVGLHTYRYNSCTRTKCGPNFCCCSGQ